MYICMLMNLFVYVYIGSRYFRTIYKYIGISFEKNSKYFLNEIFKK